MPKDIQLRELEQAWNPVQVYSAGEKVSFPNLHKDPKWDRDTGSVVIFHEHLSVGVRDLELMFW